MAKILVCDDDKDIVEAIDIYLTQEGYEVLKAYDGDEAIRVLKNNEVDLLIMDVMMPRLDGIRATLKIRENQIRKLRNQEVDLAVRTMAEQGLAVEMEQEVDQILTTEAMVVII